MVIDGYILNQAKSIEEIYSELQKCKKKIDILSEKEYYKILGKEAAFLVDKVVLGQLQDDMPIMQAAVNNTNRRIQTAGDKGEASQYNLRVYVHILMDEGHTYLNVICQNKTLLRAFRYFEDVSLAETECADDGNAKNILWRKLHAQFDGKPTITCDLSADVYKTLGTIDRQKLRYPKVKDRIRQQAIEEAFNTALEMLSHGETIHPVRLYSYIEEVFEILSTEDYQTQIRQNENKLHMLMDLNADDSNLWGKENI